MNLKLLENYTTSVGNIPYRNYYIPFSSPTYDIKKENSNNVSVLDYWNFKYFPYYSPEVESVSPFIPVKVPHNWQKIGYDIDNYVNVFYPFPYNPPFIETENPCAVYETKKIIENKRGKYYMIFDGVDSAYYVFVNGKEIGFASGSHCYHEFDITEQLVEGENTFKVIVFKLCTGSYLECQDKFRLSGIFRDVYILNRPTDHIFDYKITSSYSDNYGKINLTLDKNANVKIFDGNSLIGEKIGNKITFDIENVKLWNAEQPFLYKILIEYNGEFITDYHGIRKITIDDRVFKINDNVVKFKGVNRHSSNKNGYVETLEDIELDLKIMKEHNINTIRTSHYQPHPYLPLLCDKYGFYLVLECDIETHGDEVTSLNIATDDLPNWKRWNRISSDKNFKEMYLDRARNMYNRDKNRPSVIMWSLGNEAGWGENLFDMSNYLKSKDTRPIHYEGACRANNIDNLSYNINGTDVFSRMYPSLSVCKEILNSKELNQPFFLCEYTHAMGNSCGDINDYWKIIYNDDRFMGGCIWEWCDHAIITDDNEFLYGGDTGAKLHSGNFCVDGLVDTDRKFIHSALKEAKEVYAPVDVVYKNEKYLIFNRYDFNYLDNIFCKVILETNGKFVKELKLDLKGIKPHTYKEFNIDTSNLIKDYTTINFYFYKNNFEIAKRQVILSDKYPFSVEENSNSVKIEGDKFNGFIVKTNIATYKISKNGMIYSIFTDKELLNSPIEINTNRAFLDNDKQLKVHTFDEFHRWDILKTFKFFARDILIKDNQVIVKGYHGATSLETGINITLTYSFFDNGRVNFDIKAKQNSAYLDLITRFGLEIDLKNNFNRCNYFGRGENECYVDKKLLALISEYDKNIRQMFIYYVKPQESGSHINSRKVKLYNLDNELTVLSNKDFSFSLAPCKVKDYPSHRHLMLQKNGLVLNIDSKMRGVGSHSCGPDIENKYKILYENLNLTFDLICK